MAKIAVDLDSLPGSYHAWTVINVGSFLYNDSRCDLL